MIKPNDVINQQQYSQGSMPRQPQQQPINEGFKKPNPLMKIITLVILLLVISGGVVLATRVYDPVWNPFRPSPSRVLASALMKMKDVKTAHSDVKIRVKLPAPINENVNMLFTTDADISDVSNPREKMSFVFTGNNDSLSADVVVLNKIIYFYLKNFNLPSLKDVLSASGYDLNSAKGQWIQLPIPGEQIASTMGEQATMSSDAQEKIKNILKESNIYVIKKQLNDVKINNKDLYHYLIAIDNKKFAETFSKIFDEVTKNSEIKSSSIMTGAIKGAVEEFLDKIGEITIDSYIGKKDELMYKTTLSKTLDLSAISDLASGVIDLSIDITNSKFGEVVEIQMPENAKKVEEVFPAVKNSNIKSSLFNLQSDLSALWLKDKSYKNATCQNAMLKTECENILKYTGTTVKINKSNTKFCAYVQLFGSPTQYYCIDGGGQRVQTTINPGSKGYCLGLSYKCPTLTLPVTTKTVK